MLSNIKTRLALFLVFCFVLARQARAAIGGARELELSPPVGGNLLPGGEDLGMESIQTGTIFSKILPFAIKYAIRLAVAIAVIALIIGGYQYMTAYGDTEKNKKAQNTITYAIIGLILAITAYGIVTVLTSITLT
ncbi:hypothetical protein JXA05_01520 [Candidatus Peregrinibacteria bacterium]|nr:hypothetical protein [Candidatus Peregrinibacteria bacterium]